MFWAKPVQHWCTHRARATKPPFTQEFGNGTALESSFTSWGHEDPETQPRTTCQTFEKSLQAEWRIWVSSYPTRKSSSTFLHLAGRICQVSPSAESCVCLQRSLFLGANGRRKMGLRALGPFPACSQAPQPFPASQELRLLFQRVNPLLPSLQPMPAELLVPFQRGTIITSHRVITTRVNRYPILSFHLFYKISPELKIAQQTLEL